MNAVDKNKADSKSINKVIKENGNNDQLVEREKWVMFSLWQLLHVNVSMCTRQCIATC
jgi:hypothetical protein